MADLIPANIEAEEAILGGILIDREAIFRVVDSLKPEHFSISAHQIMYRAILTLLERGEVVDLMTVSSYLQERDQSASVGGLQKFYQLVDHTVSAVNIDRYASLVEEKYKRRQLIEASHRINSAAHESAIPIEEILSTAENEILAINSNRVQDVSTVGDCLAQVMLEFESGRPPGYLTGLIDLDNLIGGLSKKNLIVVAGRASMGKTWLGNHFALQVAGKYGLPVVFFSAEMSREALTKRFVATLARIDCQRLMWQGPRKSEWEDVSRVMEELSDLPIILDDTPGTSLTPAGMRSVLRRVQAQYGSIGLVVLDYLQLLGERNAGNRAQDIGAISGHCKAIAKEFDCPFVALAQINRGVEGASDKRPMLSGLKDSGDIEQDGDVVICLYRDEYYNPESDQKGVIELIIRKQRNGALGTAKALFTPETGLFKNI
jgi:replicative DNA helicase